MRQLSRLKLRLTAFYVGTFAAILLLLGAGLFLVLSRQLTIDLDHSLEATVAEAQRVARAGITADADVAAVVLRAVEATADPNQKVYVFDAQKRQVGGPRAEPALLEAAGDGLGDEELDGAFENGARTWRFYGQRFTPREGAGPGPFVIVAVADATKVQRQYERLVGAFVAIALLALVPIGLGGYYVARVSAAPVETAMERLRRFTADAAHELRTPVAVIRARADVALERPRTPEADDIALREIAREGQHLGRIVDDLLLLARADAGEWPIRHEPIFLDDLASESVAAAGVLAAARGVHLALGRYEEAPIAGDPALVRRLLMILLDNAVKFTDSDGVVRLDVYADTGQPTVAIADTGIGIPAEALPRLFERFYRADGVRGRGVGAGLGLAIARWISEVHGARIDIESAPGRGTIVRVRFPAERTPAARAAASGQPV